MRSVIVNIKIEDQIHLYAQHQQHDDAFILADKKALLKLKEAIENALENGRSDTGDFYTNDGEAYAIKIICSDNRDDWESVRLPYIDPNFNSQKPNAWKIWNNKKQQ